ncbi:MAG: alpha/beta hydrolase family protein, partial [Rubripirellula sp.]
PHKDTQELRIHAFRWFNRFLRQDDSLIESAAKPLFDPIELRVFAELPKDERVTTIHDTFVPETTEPLPQTVAEADALKDRLLPTIRQKCFGGWPTDSDPLDMVTVAERNLGDSTLRLIDFTSESPYRLRLYVVTSSDSKQDVVQLNLLDQPGWEELMSAIAVELPAHAFHHPPNQRAWNKILADTKNQPLAFFAPRGVGETEWSRDERTRTHIRRRFMQLGQTAAGMQTFDVLRALNALEQRRDFPNHFEVRGKGDAATWALFASLLADNVRSIQLRDLSPQNREAPDLLNVSRLLQPPHALLMFASKHKQATLYNRSAERGAWGELLANNSLAQESITLVESEDAKTK